MDEKVMADYRENMERAKVALKALTWITENMPERPGSYAQMEQAEDLAQILENAAEAANVLL